MPTMHDQPPDHGNHVTDHEPTSGDGRDQPPTDQVTTPALLTLEEAAAQLGITVNAVRQRIKRGTLLGVKTDAGWLVDADHRPATDRPPTRATNQPTNHTAIPTDQQPTIDLAPLTALIERQGKELADLREAAAVWQIRARQAEERLQAITAGEIVPQTVPEPPGSTETSEGSFTGVLAWVRRLLGR
jgi:hypothetical protein